MQNENFDNLKGKTIVLGIASSIAIYKAADLTSRLVKSGANVKVIMTRNACRLMSARIFQTLSKNKVYTSMWEDVEDWHPEHISLAESADLLLVAPATANVIGCFASGIAHDMLTTVFLASSAPVLIAPAMNCKMYDNAIVRRNIETLRSAGVEFVDPEEGMLACGMEGRGRLADIEKIISAANKILGIGL